MENKRVLSFPEFYAKGPAIPFYAMLGLFVLGNLLAVINFTEPAWTMALNARTAINAVLLWLCPMVFTVSLILWRMKPWTIGVGVGAMVLMFVLWRVIGSSNEFRGTVVAVFLALLAYKRDFRVVLKIFLAAHLIIILAAAICLGLGYATPRHKLDVDYGISLGLIYPGHLGRMVYIVLTIAWYLWFQKKTIITTVVFWVTGFIMNQYVHCLTAALLMFALPVCWMAAQFIAKHPGPVIVRRIWHGMLIALPFLCFALTYLLGQYRIPMHFALQHTRLYALAMRFISAGILFDAYGFALLGRDINDVQAVTEYRGSFQYTANIVDNAYIYYLLIFGALFMAAALAWLALANRRCIREKDRALLLIAVFMLGYGLMETVLFQFEHNFMWFYPLAATVSAIRGGDGQ